MTDTKQINNLISDSGLKKNFIAGRLGISYYALRQKLDGVTEFKTSEAAELCEVLGIDDPKEITAIFFSK